MSDKPFRLETAFRDEDIKPGLFKFLSTIGRRRFDDRVKALRATTASRPMSGRLLGEVFLIERGLSEVATFLGGRAADRVKRLPAPSRALVETAIFATCFVDSLPSDMREVFVDDLQQALTGERSLQPEWHFLGALAWFARNGCRFWLRDDADAPLMGGIAGTDVAILPVALDADAGRRVGRRAWFGLADQLAPLFASATGPDNKAVLIAIEFDNEPPEDLTTVVQTVKSAIEQKAKINADGWSVQFRELDKVRPGMETTDVLKVLAEHITPGAHYALTESDDGLLAIAAWSKAKDDIPAALLAQLEELVETSGNTVVPAFIEEVSPDEWQRHIENDSFRARLTDFLNARPEVTGLRLSHAGHLLTRPGAAPLGDVPTLIWNPSDERDVQLMRAALG